MSTEVLRVQIEYFKRAHIKHKEREQHHAHEAIRLAQQILIAEMRLRNATEAEIPQQTVPEAQQTTK